MGGFISVPKVLLLICVDARKDEFLGFFVATVFVLECQRQGIHPRPIKQKQAQVHVPYSTRHDKLDECIKQTRTPSACHHRRQHHGKKRHHAAPTKPTRESKSSMGAARCSCCGSAFYFRGNVMVAGMKQMRLPPSRSAIVCGSCAPTKKPYRTKPPAPAFSLLHTTLSADKAGSVTPLYYNHSKPHQSIWLEPDFTVHYRTYNKLKIPLRKNDDVQDIMQG